MQNQHQVSPAMQAGFQSKRINHGKLRGWIVRERDSEEINANRSIEGKG
jgi:hypothetical protein